MADATRGATTGASSLEWVVVVPVKGSNESKTRLAGVPAIALERRELSIAFAQDSVSAILAAEGVREVLVVTSDAGAAEVLSTLGAAEVLTGLNAGTGATGSAGKGATVVVLPDPGSGLNDAISVGIVDARRRHPEYAVAAITADLPTLDPADVSAGLRLAAEHPSAFVADFEGVGTTTITARPGVVLVPRFGVGSAARHAAAGLVCLALPAESTLRHDVDTPRDLDAARPYVGRHTAALLPAHTL